MKFSKIAKGAFFASLIGIPTYYGVKFFLKLKESWKLNETLPDYLNDVLSEKPIVYVSYTPMLFEIRIGLHSGTKEQKENIHSIVNDYIEDFYPLLAKADKKIIIFEANEASKT